MVAIPMRFRVTAVILIIVVLFHAFYTAAWNERAAGLLRTDFDNQINSTLTFVAPPLATSLWEFDVTQAERTIVGLNELPFFQFAVVTSFDEPFLTSVAIGEEWRDAWRALVPDGEIENGKIVRHVAEDIVAVTIAVTHETGQRVGKLTLGFSLEHITALERQAFEWALLFGSLYLFAIGAVLYGFTSYITAPLSDVAETVRRFGDGELVVPTKHTTRNDEIGELARAVVILQENHAEARTDGLTALPNRRALADRLTELSDQTHYGFAVIDLDEFKPINDTLGHDVGDFVLLKIAERIASLDKGEAFRLGGDEFVVIWSDLNDRDDAADRTQALADMICRPITHELGDLDVDVSIGVALASDVDGGASDVLSAADETMYAAKRDAGIRVLLFDGARMRRRYGVQHRKEIETALEEGCIEAWFQPQVSLATQEIIGFEALARWRDPKKGLLSPGVFLPMVEALRMQRQFDIAMVRQVLEHVRRWRSFDICPMTVSINLAEETLATSDGVDQLFWLLDEFVDCKDMITLEITEDVFTARSAEAIRRALQRLFDAGMRISMDDFGTGYGSLRHLQEYQFHELKIDRGFVDKIGKDRSTEVIIDGFLAIADGLGAQVVAEGIETEAQARHLAARGCELGQGYYFGRPASSAETDQIVIERMLASVRDKHLDALNAVG